MELYIKEVDRMFFLHLLQLLQALYLIFSLHEQTFSQSQHNQYAPLQAPYLLHTQEKNVTPLSDRLHFQNMVKGFFVMLG